MTSEKPLEMHEEAAFAELCKRIRRRGIEGTISCPMCGAEQWAGAVDVGVLVLANRDAATGEAEHEGSLHMVGTTCLRCGFVATFDRRVIGD